MTPELLQRERNVLKLEAIQSLPIKSSVVCSTGAICTYESSASTACALYWSCYDLAYDRHTNLLSSIPDEVACLCFGESEAWRERFNLQGDNLTAHWKGIGNSALTDHWRGIWQRIYNALKRHWECIWQCINRPLTGHVTAHLQCIGKALGVYLTVHWQATDGAFDSVFTVQWKGIGSVFDSALTGHWRGIWQRIYSAFKRHWECIWQSNFPRPKVNPNSWKARLQHCWMHHLITTKRQQIL